MASLNFQIAANEDYTCSQADLDALTAQIIHPAMRDANYPRQNVPALIEEWRDSYPNDAARTATQAALVNSREHMKTHFRDFLGSIRQLDRNYGHWQHLPAIASANPRVRELAKRLWSSTTEYNERQKLCEMLYTAIVLLHYFKNTVADWGSVVLNGDLKKKFRPQRTLEKLIPNMVAYIPMMIAMGGEESKVDNFDIQQLNRDGSPYYRLIVQTVFEHALFLFPQFNFDLVAMHSLEAKSIFSTYKSKVKSNGIFDLNNLRQVNLATNPTLPRWASGLPYQVWNIFKILNKDARKAKLNDLLSIQGLAGNGAAIATANRANDIQITFPGQLKDRPFLLKGECLYGSGHNDSMESGGSGPQF